MENDVVFFTTTAALRDQIRSLIEQYSTLQAKICGSKTIFFYNFVTFIYDFLH